MSRFYSWLARLAVRHTRTVAIVWVVVLVAAVFGAVHLEKQLKVGGFSLPGTEFNTASKLLSDDLQISSDRATVVVYTLADPARDRQALRRRGRGLARTPREAALRDEDPVLLRPGPAVPRLGRQPHDVRDRDDEGLGELPPDGDAVDPPLANAPPLVTHLVGQSAVNYDVQKASAEDLVKVERFTLPIVALLLVLVFGSVVAAAVPLVMGAVSVAAALSLVYLLALVSDVSIFALNIGSMIGLGLAIDFSLIMVSRFREE